MSKAQIVMIAGIALIVVGLGMTIFQMIKDPSSMRRGRSATVRPTGITLKTTYPGLIVVAIGVVMVIAGAAIP